MLDVIAIFLGQVNTNNLYNLVSKHSLAAQRGASLTSYCKFISFRAEQASQQHLDTETGTHQKVFKVVKSVKHFFPSCFLPLNFLTLLLSPIIMELWNRDFWLRQELKKC